MEKNKSDFQSWLETKEGKECMKPDSFVTPNKLQYLENRLWYAFTAGQGSIIEPKTETSGTETKN